MELLGLLLPALIDLINRKISDSDIRFWVSVLVCSIFGVGLNFIQTSFGYATLAAAAKSLGESIMVVFGLAQLSYKGIWETSSLRAKIVG